MLIAHIPSSDLRYSRMAKSIVATLAVGMLAFLVVYVPPQVSSQERVSPAPATVAAESRVGDVFVPTTVEIKGEGESQPPTF